MTRNSMLVAAIVAALGLGVGLWFALEPAEVQPGPTAGEVQPEAGAPAPSTAGTPDPRPSGGEQTAGGTTAPSGGGTAAPSVTPSIDPASGGGTSGSSGQKTSGGTTSPPAAFQPAPQPPTFDIVRVEKDGSTVVAGRAPAGSEVTLFDGDTALGTVRAGSDGSFALVLDQPLTPGSRSLSLAAKTKEGTMVPSAGEVMVVVPDLKAASVAAAAPAPAPAASSETASGTTGTTGTASSGTTTAEAASIATTEPAATEPAATEPATAETASAEPATTAPAASTAGETAASGDAATASSASTGESDTAASGGSSSGESAATASAGATTSEAVGATAEATAAGTASVDAAASAGTAAGGETTASAGTEAGSTQVAAVDPAPEAAPQPASPIVVASSPTGASVVLQVPGDIKDDTLRVEAVDYDLKGQVVVSGRAPAGSAVAIYLDDALLGQVTTGADGRWVYTPDSPVAEGLHRLRADQLAADGSVTARAEIPFSRAGTIELAANEDFVVVQPGNCLWLIARAKYGDGFQYTQIYEANAQQIRDPDLIYPGQIFLVPKIN